MWPTFESIKYFYDINCYTNEDIQTYVELGCLTKEDYARITKEEYQNDKEDGIPEGHY